MQGLMMNSALTLTGVMRHARNHFPEQEIVSVTADNPLHRCTYSQAFNRAGQLANVLRKLGAKPGDRIGTLAWNDYRHFEIYYATSCSGLICHTINPRLFAEQIAYIVQHAEDQWLFLDPLFMPLIESLAPSLPSVKGYVILTDKANMPATELAKVYCYESFLGDGQSDFNWPELSENTAASLCYTSGTTGNPKGVLYSHRAMALHTYGLLMPDSFPLSSVDVVLPVVPMFHVNAWSIPYAAAAVGAKLVLPGAKMGCGETLTKLMAAEGVTAAAGVPTIWLALLRYLNESGKKLPALKRVLVGGSACPWSIMQAFERDHGIYTHHAWGMTEMSPLGTVNPRVPAGLTEAKTKELRLKQGKAAYGVEMRIVDDQGVTLARDGVAYGALQVRGPWICERYFMAQETALTADGWFDTGDVATIDAQGYLGITDRSKDVIKSGGEWISSIELENLAMTFSGVVEAAVIAVPHEKWDERPLLVVVASKGSELNPQAILDQFEGKVAKWWIPNDCVVVAELPHTATGKVSKKDLRAQFVGYRWPGDE